MNCIGQIMIRNSNRSIYIGYCEFSDPYNNYRDHSNYINTLFAIFIGQALRKALESYSTGKWIASRPTHASASRVLKPYI